MPTVTVFTPTYNRKDLLRRGYEALCRQTSLDFLWLIIDDGSTDNTEALVREWMAEAPFEIRYLYKENGGLYTGYNTAIEHLDTELAVCIDSDDYMPDTAVERIVTFWRENGSKDVAGMIGLDVSEDGKPLGSVLPDQKTINPIDLLIGTYKLQESDRKYVLRCDLYKQYGPLPTIPDERDLNPHLLHVQIAADYDYLVFNEPLCVVEYQADGMTSGIFKQYVRSPKSFLIMRQSNLSIKRAPLSYKIKNCMHYVASALFAHQSPIKGSPQKFLTALCVPFGLLLAVYIKYKARE